MHELVQNLDTPHVLRKRFPSEQVMHSIWQQWHRVQPGDNLPDADYAHVAAPNEEQLEAEGMNRHGTQ